MTRRESSKSRVMPTMRTDMPSGSLHIDVIDGNMSTSRCWRPGGLRMAAKAGCCLAEDDGLKPRAANC